MLIRWTPRAFNDLKTISSHIERQRNLATANRVCRIIHRFVQEVRARRAKFDEQLQDGVLGRAGHTDSGINRTPLDQTPNHLGASCCIHPVHIYSMRARERIVN